MQTLKMHKCHFYRCIRNELNVIVAEKVSGYCSGDIGVYKLPDTGSENVWVPVWIPNGLKIAGIQKTRIKAIKAAMEVVENVADFNERCVLFEGTDAGKAFAKSKYEQTVTNML